MQWQKVWAPCSPATWYATAELLSTRVSGRYEAKASLSSEHEQDPLAKMWGPHSSAKDQSLLISHALNHVFVQNICMDCLI